jgi:hypothetical protein
MDARAAGTAHVRLAGVTTFPPSKIAGPEVVADPSFAAFREVITSAT